MRCCRCNRMPWRDRSTRFKLIRPMIIWSTSFNGTITWWFKIIGMYRFKSKTSGIDRAYVWVFFTVCQRLLKQALVIDLFRNSRSFHYKNMDKVFGTLCNRRARREQSLLFTLFKAFYYIESSHKSDCFLWKDLLIFVYARATLFELPSIKNTMAYTGLVRMYCIFQMIEFSYSAVNCRWLLS